MRGSGSWGFGSGVGVVLSSVDMVGWWPPDGDAASLWPFGGRDGRRRIVRGTFTSGGPDPHLLRRHPSCRDPVTNWARLTPNRRRIGVRRSENAVVEDA